MIRILHCHSTFDAGGKELRAVALMNAFGKAARHTILSGVAGAFGAASAIARDVRVAFPDDHPSLTGRPSIARYRALAEYMARFDLVLTYNWGAMDAVMARRIYAKDCPPLVHHEDGFNADEAARLKPERNMYRRLALGGAHALVVPSTTLERVALSAWKQPSARVRRIGNGIPTQRYGKPTMAIPGWKRPRDHVVIGTLAGLRPVKNLKKLVRAAAAVPESVLVIVGDGPDRAAIRAEGDACGMGDRLVMPGHLPDPWRYLGHFDVFALSSDSEQAPVSLIEAMAAGLPVVATNVGDVAAMVDPVNHDYIVDPADECGFMRALNVVAGDERVRRVLGPANRAFARAHHDAGAMIAAYREVYGQTMGRPL